MKIPESKIRHYCTCCNSKLYESDLQEIYYPLLKKSFWHCEKCMSINVDNLHQKISKKQPYLIEFFSGSKTVSKVASTFNYKTFNYSNIFNLFSTTFKKCTNKRICTQLNIRLIIQPFLV